MKPYISRSGKESGVSGYEIYAEGILVQFNAVNYMYTYASAGHAVIEEMKVLALNQKGLSTYISRNNPPYEWKLK